MAQNNTPSIWAFIALELYAGIGFLVMQLTAILSSNVRRSRVWYCFCMSWTLFCVSCCLLFFSGQQFTDKPTHGICLAQASLVYSGPAFIISVSLSLLLELHWRISFASSPGRTVLAERARSPWLLAGPIALWLILTLIYVIFGTSSLSNAAPTLDNGLYCTFPNPFPRTFNSVVCLIISLIDVFLLGLVLRAIIRHENKSIAHQYKGTVIRVVVMIVLGLAAVIATAIMASQDQSSIAVHIAGQACLPAAVMTLFGSQKALLNTWKEAAKSVLRV
ncbi:hypothetical protein Moror_5729 [Moniliophthora roreri MCA 2997]|uniref:G-protein coupled receptors family 3 profile domain-containing protein n=1 Tax=Moniliophthora roreri (strain MCA 2997) TaxID=1381753 RepID=V2X4D0_MONRO|nr:hypothetical protein Moror_5729 [Moniliophthora roreri MCA 2997]